MLSLKQEILSLPPEEREARRAFYSDEEWDSWELNAYPFQLEPLSDDWTVWTIIAPRRTGKTTAGEHWALEKHQREKANVLCIFRDRKAIEPTLERFIEALEASATDRYVKRSTPADYLQVLYNSDQGTSLICASEQMVRGDSLRGLNRFDYVWADEVMDADVIRARIPPPTKKFLFTQPTRLSPDTIISRAGDPRAR